MPIEILVLYGAFVVVNLIILALLYTSGNFFGLFPASAWLAVDSAVTAFCIVTARSPQYMRFWPRATNLDATLMAVALVWLFIDVLRHASPLSLTFFWTLAGVRGAWFVRDLAYRHGVAPKWGEFFYACIFGVVAAVMIAALLLPIPPDLANQKDVEFSPVTGAPVPMLAQQGQR